MLIAQVIPFKRLPPGKNFFDYYIPREFEKKIKKGGVVEVPWRQSRSWGIIFAIKKFTVQEAVKEITNVAEGLCIPPYFLDIIASKSSLWQTSFSTALKSAIPEFPKKFSTIESLFLKENGPPIRASLAKGGTADYFRSIGPQSFAIPSSWLGEIKDIRDKIISSPKPVYIQSKNSALKTAIFLSFVKLARKENKKCAIVFPTKNHLEFYIPYLKSVFGDNNIFINNSDLDSFIEINKIKNMHGSYLIIGLRSAVWSPIEADIYLLEGEDNENFAEKRKPNYKAQEMLVEIAKRTNSKVALAGSRPTLYLFSEVAGRNVLKLEADFFLKKFKKTYVNLKDERKMGNSGHISFVLEDLIKKTLEEGRSVLLFHNRKGWGKRFVCAACGAECYDMEGLECPFCKNFSLKSKSLGTQKIDFWVKKELPNIPIIRIEGTAESLPSIKEPSIIIVTQSLFSFPTLSLNWNVGLVSILALENNFLVNDFRRREKEALLLARMEEVANSMEAKHLVIQHWEKVDYDEKKEIEWRRKLSLPL